MSDGRWNMNIPSTATLVRQLLWLGEQRDKSAASTRRDFHPPFAFVLRVGDPLRTRQTKVHYKFSL